MKFSLERQRLLDALLIVSRAVSTRTALQALSGIHVTVANGSISLEATDMELGISVAIDAAAETDGSVVLPGRLLVDVIRSLPEGAIGIELRESERDVEITAGSSRFHLRTLPAADFPRLPAAEGEAVTLPAAPLHSTIDRVARAASRDDARPVLTGILFNADGNRLTMVATDSYRLAVKETELEEAVPNAIEANVPARALRELSRLTESAGAEQVELWLTPNHAIFKAGDVRLSSRLIDGQFPDHRQLLPKSYEHEVTLPRDELLEVTRRIAQLAQRNAPLKLSFAPGELLVSAETPDLGDAREAMPVKFEGEPIEIGFNPQFVIDGIESVDSDDLVMKLIAPLRPGLIQPVDGERFTYLVMPIRLNT